MSNQIVTGPIDIQSIFFIIEVHADQPLFTNIIQNILFYGQTKELHAGLEHVVGE